MDQASRERHPMTPSVEVHILTMNEAEMIRYAIRHYATFCQRIVIEDLGSNDGTQAVAKEMGAEVVQHDGRGEFNDLQNKTIKNTCWLGTSCDWVICADADELIYFPGGAEKTLASYDTQQVPVANPFGFEMCSEQFPTGDGQIYQYVKHGARDDYWYGKKVLFSPKRVAVIDFGAGAHVTHATLHGGRKITLDSKSPPTSPPCYLLHCHHLGSVERIGAKYEAVIARLSAQNRLHKQGVQRDGMGHSREKRRAIMAKLERILP
jgi:hypothetical protein